MPTKNDILRLIGVLIQKFSGTVVRNYIQDICTRWLLRNAIVNDGKRIEIRDELNGYFLKNFML